MWKKAIIYFLLLSFINTAFLPGEPVDATPLNGMEEAEEEYNTLYELITEGFLGMHDSTPEDEDDDNPDWLKKTSDFFCKHTLGITLSADSHLIDYMDFVIINRYLSFLEISSPPPKFV